MRIISVPRPPFPPELVEELRGVQPLYHPDPRSLGFLQLKDAGLDVRPLVAGDFSEGAILMPPASGELERLEEIVIRLLRPDGCPWDRKQTHESLKKHLVEEAYELCEAIDDKNQPGMVEELGDVLLQPLMHAEMARISGSFSLDDVTSAICDKLIRRHPHVFGDASAEDADAVLRNWDAVKRQEKGSGQASLVEGVPRSMPGLLRALEVSKRAARAGFEWEDVDDIWTKFDEERAEYASARKAGSQEDAASEMGDLLFTLVNIARRDGIDPESALHSMVKRFTARFKAMEAAASKPLIDLTAREWDDLWNEAKRAAVADSLLGHVDGSEEQWSRRLGGY